MQGPQTVKRDQRAEGQLTFEEKLQDLHVAEGQKLLLQCKGCPLTPTTVTWTLNGKDAPRPPSSSSSPKKVKRLGREREPCPSHYQLPEPCLLAMLIAQSRVGMAAFTPLTHRLSAHPGPGAHTLLLAVRGESGPRAHSRPQHLSGRASLMAPPGMAPQRSLLSGLMPHLWPREGSNHRLGRGGTRAGAGRGLGAESCL